MTVDDLAGRYLEGRTNLTAYPPILRYVADERYAELSQRPSFRPAFVAKVDPPGEAVASGERAAINRTYLSKLGGKVEVAAPRKMFCAMPTGAAVRLAPAGEVLGIAEVIETAISAGRLFNLPCWATLSADLLAKWTPPDCVRTVLIFSDHDATYTGQAATFALAKRLTVKGIEVAVQPAPAMGRTGTMADATSEG